MIDKFLKFSKLRFVINKLEKHFMDIKVIEK